MMTGPRARRRSYRPDLAARPLALNIAANTHGSKGDGCPPVREAQTGASVPARRVGARLTIARPVRGSCGACLAGASTQRASPPRGARVVRADRRWGQAPVQTRASGSAARVRQPIIKLFHHPLRQRQPLFRPTADGPASSGPQKGWRGICCQRGADPSRRGSSRRPASRALPASGGLPRLPARLLSCAGASWLVLGHKCIRGHHDR